MKANIQPSSTLMTASLSSLPLPPPSQRIQSLLTHTPPSNPSKASTFLQTLHHAPSTQRRSTTFASGHLTNLTPLPIAFPYRLPVKIGDDGERVAAVGVEEWLTALEPLHHHHPHDQQQPSSQSTDSLSVYTSSARSWPTLLLAISPACLSETLPHLDVGDALDIVKTDLPAGSIAQDGEEPTHIHETGGDNAARDELIGVLGGREVLMNLDEGENGYKPWSLRYGGRQFGSWASQLGDGRAISLIETVTPSGEIQEIQIKGGGRTPYSRHADGLAVLRSSLREFLGAEGASAFPCSTLPTSRSLTLTLLPTLKVLREYGPEPGAITSRIAPSFLRIGSFEMMNPPKNEFLFSWAMGGGGGAGTERKVEWDGLVKLADVVKAKLWGFEEGKNKTIREMVGEIAKRNAEMVAGWQAWGFMHGVINTDNVSVLGLTIDYGPYAYMDVFDRNHICNHSDETGRYAYAAQPEMVYYAINALIQSLSELLGYELAHPPSSSSFSSPSLGWASDLSSETLTEYRQKGMELESDIKSMFDRVYEKRYRAIMRRRFGLLTTTTTMTTTLVEQDGEEDEGIEEAEEDMRVIIKPFLDVLERNDLDFHRSLRTLCFFEGSAGGEETEENRKVKREEMARRIVAGSSSTTTMMMMTAAGGKGAEMELEAWLEVYEQRLRVGGRRKEEEEKRRETMKKWNPRFVLRQWVLEEIIKKVQTGQPGARGELTKLVEMTTHPFAPWGREETDLSEGVRPGGVEQSTLSEAERVERRLCGLGAEKMLGFQCSCSS